MINIIRVFILAYKSHRGQKDKGGKPYIFHPLKVFFNVKGKDEKIVALLHDILEDTEEKIENIYYLTKSQKKALILFSKSPDLSYSEYIQKIKENSIAKNVKLADLKHNSNIKRITNPTKNDLKRIEKYKKSIEFLKS